MSVIKTDKFYVTVSTKELMEVISMGCMPLIDYDVDKFEDIKSTLSEELEVPVLETDIWKSKHTYVYAMCPEYVLGVTDVLGEHPRIFVDYEGTNADVVIRALQSLVDKFGSPLVELPDTLKS